MVVVASCYKNRVKLQPHIGSPVDQLWLSVTLLLQIYAWISELYSLVKCHHTATYWHVHWYLCWHPSNDEHFVSCVWVECWFIHLFCPPYLFISGSWRFFLLPVKTRNDKFSLMTYCSYFYYFLAAYCIAKVMHGLKSCSRAKYFFPTLGFCIELSLISTFKGNTLKSWLWIQILFEMIVAYIYFKLWSHLQS